MMSTLRALRGGVTQKQTYLQQSFINGHLTLTWDHPRVGLDKLGVGQQGKAVAHEVIGPPPGFVQELAAELPLGGACICNIKNMSRVTHLVG